MNTPIKVYFYRIITLCYRNISFNHNNIEFKRKRLIYMDVAVFNRKGRQALRVYFRVIFPLKLKAFYME